ncbi:MAG: FAD-dependent oxidoreductase, partial [Candidatus Aenigmatarchaeota archaeon]
MIQNFIDSEYDVVVIGAGPAGSSTAKSCSSLGLKTLLIEKRSEIGAPKRCAEGLSTHASEEFNINIPKYCIAQTIDGAIVYAPNGKRFEIKLKGETH